MQPTTYSLPPATCNLQLACSLHPPKSEGVPQQIIGKAGSFDNRMLDWLVASLEAGSLAQAAKQTAQIPIPLTDHPHPRTYIRFE